MGKLKPPTPASVSATLRAADFKAAKRIPPLGMYKLSEGYQAAWRDRDVSVCVDFMTDDESGIREEALTKMQRVLSRKGWAVRAVAAEPPRKAHLLVTER